MIKEQQQVKEFMIKAGQECPAKPAIPSLEVRKLRIKLIQEELDELMQASNIHRGEDQNYSSGYSLYEQPFYKPSLEKSYDAILDLLVVVIGTAVAFGLEIEPGWQEVIRSNNSKFVDGYKREDGKWIKGPSYSPANLQPIIDLQLCDGHFELKDKPKCLFCGSDRHEIRDCEEVEKFENGK